MQPPYFALIFCIFVYLFSAVKGLPCYPGWSLFEDSCYFVSDEKASWIHARKHCLDMESHLVTISGQEEDRHVNTLIADQVLDAEERVWIGLTDYLDEGNYRWDDGSKLNYTNWAIGEPNNFNLEHCAVIHLRQWNDFACDWNLKYICKKKRDFTISENSEDEYLFNERQERLEVYRLTKELLQTMRAFMENVDYGFPMEQPIHDVPPSPSARSPTKRLRLQTVKLMRNVDHDQPMEQPIHDAPLLGSARSPITQAHSSPVGSHYSPLGSHSFSRRPSPHRPETNFNFPNMPWLNRDNLYG